MRDVQEREKKSYEDWKNQQQKETKRWKRHSPAKERKKL